MSTDSPLVVVKKDLVGMITLSSPDTLNVLGTPSLNALIDALKDMGEDRRIRVVIITGMKHFSAGADIKEMRDKNPAEAKAFAYVGHEICDRIEQMEKPVIAAVCGYALGGGCEIALSCDIRLASEDAKFGQPEVGLGLIPGFGGTQRMARLLGIGRAKELILTGRMIDAKEAEAVSLVNSVVKTDELLQRADETAALLLKKGPYALGAAKKLINENQEIRRGLENEIASFSKCFETEDHTEGIKAFLEKRPPEFKNR
jgi:enoyl-CoA hydratase